MGHDYSLDATLSLTSISIESPMTKILIIPFLLVAPACVTTSTEAVMGGPQLPGMPDVQYRIIGPIDGRGHIVQVSPGIVQLMGGPSAKHAAVENAVGAAIFNRENVDVMIAPKSRIKLTSYLGIVDVAEAEVKGQGCQITGPK